MIVECSILLLFLLLDKGILPSYYKRIKLWVNEQWWVEDISDTIFIIQYDTLSELRCRRNLTTRWMCFIQNYESTVQMYSRHQMDALLIRIIKTIGIWISNKYIKPAQVLAQDVDEIIYTQQRPGGRGDFIWIKRNHKANVLFYQNQIGIFTLRFYCPLQSVMLASGSYSR